jgi:hypothetical protein
MPYLYRVVRPNGSATYVGCVEAIEKVVVDGAPGHYPIDEVDLDLRAARHISRYWGVGVKRADGSVVIESDSVGSVKCPRMPQERSTPSTDA